MSSRRPGKEKFQWAMGHGRAKFRPVSGYFLGCLAHLKKECSPSSVFSFFSIHIHVYDYIYLILF